MAHISRSRQAGSLLVITLWIIVVLAMIAVALGGYLSTETRLARYHLAHAQARAWARAGVYLALERLAVDAQPAGPTTEDLDWLGDDWAYFPGPPLNPEAGAGPQAAPDADPTVWVVSIPAHPQDPAQLTGRLAIRISDEERKLNLNTAAPEHLTGLGLPDEVAQAIVAYREPDDPPDPTEDRPELTPPYYAKDAPIRIVHELLDVPALQEDSASAQTLLQEGTVSTEGQPNLNTVSLAVLQAIKGKVVQAGLLDAFVTRRGAGPDGTLGTTDDCLFSDDSGMLTQLATCLGTGESDITTLVADFGYTSAIFRVVAEVVIPARGVRVRLEAVVKRGSSADGTLQVGGTAFQVLRWKEG